MKTRITIRGQQYTVRSDEPDIDLHEIAAYVDAKMAEVAGRSSSFDNYTVAMLAALNIASDFERFRTQVDQELDEIDREVASAALLMESALPGSTLPEDGSAEESG
jgi:cell division protein ZapA